jgi:hypothetical protein
MSRLLIGGAVAAAIAIGVVALTGGDDEPAKPAAPAAGGVVPADRAAVAADTPSTAAPRRTVPGRPGTRALPADVTAPSAPPPSSGAGEAAPPPELPPDEPLDKAGRIKAAQDLLEHGDYEAALAAGVALIEENPREHEGYSVAIPSLCAMGEKEQAEAYIVRVRKKKYRKPILKMCRKLGLEIEVGQIQPP